MSQLSDRDLGTDSLRDRRDGVSARELYAATADPEGSYASAEAVEALRGELLAAGRPEDGDLAARERNAAAWATDERERVSSLVREGAYREPLVQRAVLGGAPLGLMSGAWLQWLSAPGNCHDEAVLAVLALYASDLDVGNPRASRGDAYLELLRQLRLADHASPAARLVHDHRVRDYAFRIPAMLLAMGRRPDEFFAELLGADLCLRNVGLPPSLAAVHDAEGVHPDWAALDPAKDRCHEWRGGLARCRVAIACYLRNAPATDERRVLAGFTWVRGALAEWAELLRAELTNLDPAGELAELLKLRAREGAVYHEEFELDGRRLSSWLQESRTDPRPLMDALAASELVRPGRAEASELVTGLVGELGPMFRVFAPEDLAVIRRWIDALPASEERGPPIGLCPPSSSFPAATLARPRVAGDAPASVRDAYHLLQRRGDPPALSEWAASYVRGWLARSRPRLGADDRQLPELRAPAGLRPWLLDQHDLHARQFAAEQSAPLPSREALIESTVQTAPLTLIDGSWLHGFTDYQHASTELGRLLFETYWDELGDGEPRLNHPRIYRRLLEEMGVELPPTVSREFAESTRLNDRSFELPVYWLSIGRFPRTFMPEILGLNLAMELSGVGGSYRLARIVLKHHGFSTRFVDVHNTIDNVATGHAAWAADAVDTLIAAIGEAQGREAQAEAWQRVRIGFVSLDPPAGRRVRIAQRRAQRRALKSRSGS
ncbi:MAG TPA: iron-containing redox enzyme family protein [Solirubrobacteraceae bacterium]|nr:iron-containing redox enzyme family protein [Solirubrobacteraceae bacterium]